jgi:hypothetical protein
MCEVSAWFSISAERIVVPDFFFGGGGESQIHTEVLSAICRRLFVTYLVTRKLTHFFQQDSKQAHTTNSSACCSEGAFRDRIISRGLCSPCSPALKPCDFHLWGTLKGKVRSDNLVLERI